MITLTISDKAGQKSRYDFNKNEITIGRMKENDIVLPKGNVSKKHATITLQDGQYIVVDYESTNGSYINGVRLTPYQTYNVAPNMDKLYIGDFVIEMEPLGQGSAMPAPPRTALPPLPPGSATGTGNDEGRAGFDTLFESSDKAGQDLRSTFPGQSNDYSPEQHGQSGGYDPLRMTMAGGAPDFDPASIGTGSGPNPPLNLGATPYVPTPPNVPARPPEPVKLPEPIKSTTPPPIQQPVKPSVAPISMPTIDPKITPVGPANAGPHPSKPNLPALTPTAYVHQRPEVISEFDADFFVAQLDVIMALLDLSPMNEWPRVYPVDEAERTRYEELIAQAIEEAQPEVDHDTLTRVLLAEAVGLGALDLYLDDPEVQDIYINKYDQIMLRKEGKLYQARHVYSTPESLRLAAERLLGPDAAVLGADELRFADGARVHAMMPPAAIGGPIITVRKPPSKQPNLTDLIQREVLSAGMADFLMRAVDAGRSIAICGPTSSGKTTLLSALASLIHDGMRVVSIEDYSHLELPQASAVRLEANISAGFDKRFLMRQALAMHPQRILLDECKGSEGYDWVTGVAAGTEGSMITLHGINAQDALGRLESLCYLGGDRISPRGVREQIARAVNLLVVVNRVGNQQFRVQQITEVQGVDLDAYRLNDIFYYRAEGVDGAFHPTGYMPLFYEDLQNAGIDVDFDIFRE